MSNKDDALQEIALIARNNKLSIEDIIRALAPSVEKTERESRSIISRLFGYIGGILVFAGICIFVGMQWENFGSAARVIVTLGTGFAAFLFALAITDDSKYSRAATPLFLIAALFQPGGIFVMLDEYSSGGKPEHGVLFMAGVMILQQAATFWHTKRSTLAFTTIVFSCIFFVTLFDMMGIEENIIGLVTGLSLMCVAWALGKSPHRPLCAFWYFVGAATFLISTFDLVEGTPFEIVYLAIAAFMIYISTVAQSRTLLLVGTLAMLCYIGYFTGKHFSDSLSWPIVLILCGVLFIGLGSLAMRINRKYIQQKAG